MKTKDSLRYISRGVVLDSEVWAALAKLKTKYGSYNKGLRVLLLSATNGQRRKMRRDEPD